MLALAAAALRIHLWSPLTLVGEPPRDGFTRVSGVVHVHSTASDGSGTPQEIAAAAKAAGARFVIVTDHNTLDAKPSEGYHDGVLLLVGIEASTTAGHVLGLGIRKPAFRFSGDAFDAVDDIRALRGAAFVAHPASPRVDFRWTRWDLPGRWGVELLNGDSQWREAGKARLAGTLLRYPLNARYALLRSLTEPTQALTRWDSLTALRDAPAIAGADAHARVVVRGRHTLRLPAYEPVLALAQNHVLLEAPLTGDAAVDGKAIVRALAAGRSYLALDALAPGSGFGFTAGAPGVTATMGDTIAVDPAPRLRAGGRLPEGALVRLLRNGRVVAEQRGGIDMTAPGAGVYRVEVRVPGWDVPWVISNPIYVFDAQAAAMRAGHGEWIDDPRPPAVAEVIDDFQGATIFAPAVDPSSSLDASILAPHGGVGSSGAGRMRFRLGVPTDQHPDVYCALIATGDRSLAGRTGLTFSIRGDAEYRLWVQVRDHNPASNAEQTEWWFASVRTAPDWRRVTLPFASLRSIDPRTDGRLDLDKVKSLVFVIDKGSLEPGTKGIVWIDDVGVY